MIIHPEFIFAHIPKTGGMFVKKCLSKLKDVKITKDRHKPIDDINEKSDKYKFTIIRDPLSWYISFWSDYKRSAHSAVMSFMTDEMRNDFKTFMWNIHSRDDRTCYDDLENFSNVSRLNIGMCTYNFLVLTCPRKLWCEEKNISFSDVYDSILVDKIIQFSSFKKDIVEMFKNSIFPLPDPVEYAILNNKPFNITIHEPPIEYYDLELIDFVKRKDRILFKLFEDKI